MLDTSHKYFRIIEEDEAAVFFHPFTANPFPQWAKNGIFGVRMSDCTFTSKAKINVFKKILNSEGPFETASFEIIFEKYTNDFNPCCQLCDVSQIIVLFCGF